MKYSQLNEYSFHDSVVKKITYSDNRLVLQILDCYHNEKRANVNLEFNVDTYDFEFFLLNQFPFFHNATIKGKEISMGYIQELFNKGKMLQIISVYLDTEQGYLIYECDIIPSNRGGGRYKKIILRLGCDDCSLQRN